MLQIAQINGNWTLSTVVTNTSSSKSNTADNCADKESKTSSLALTQKNMNLRFIPGQRGKSLLCFNNFTYAQNNVCGNTTYWNCRSRRVGQKPCKARITTTKQPNGLFRVCLTKPEHNHEPSPRVLRKIEKSL
ncbi:uncharacterized protein LOC118737287 [Rhagoletis pomonella]|uniref:uncharacterized protein LOC118737287 n=1 Tax=Rhagoletis pomonella TaxID=28610 RepID=UPI00177B54C4|nr:uncharacterized protein LOC118737287 [Rhagoletis pomonella]